MKGDKQKMAISISPAGLHDDTFIAPRRRLTNAEYWAFVHAPAQADTRYLLFEGELYEMPAPSPLHTLIMLALIDMFRRYLAAHPEMDGWIFSDNTDLELAPGFVLQADVTYFTKARLPKIPRRIQIAPDFAVEIASPSNREPELLAQCEAYIRHGARLAWVLFPHEKSLLTLHPMSDGGIALYRHAADSTVTGGEVLPGFSVMVRDLIPDLPLADDAAPPAASPTGA